MAIILQSTAFENGAPIPAIHTGDGRDVSPPLCWSGLPDGVEELALIVEDPDAPCCAGGTGAAWVHWVIYRISPATRELSQAVPARVMLEKPVGAYQGVNSWGRIGYNGPAPPSGHGTHHYRFRLFALGRPLDLFHSLAADAVDQAMHGHVLDTGLLVGTYARP